MRGSRKAPQPPTSTNALIPRRSALRRSKAVSITGRGGIVRKVPRKPARIGICHYQAVVMLPTDDPFLAYTSVHNTSGSLGESTQTAQIVNEWADLVLSFRQPTIICMDSYYLCKVGRETLRQKNVRFIAAIKPDRFKRITALLTPSVQNAGKSAYAFIGDRNEAAVMHWSRDTNIGKKFVLTNCFTRVPQKKPLITCPFMTSAKVCSPAVTSSISNSMERLSRIRLPTIPIWPKRKIFGIISSLLS